MTRNKIEITFLALPAVGFLVSYKYYANPASSNILTTVVESAVTLRAAAGQFTIGANTSATATNYAAALALDYPGFTTVVVGDKVTVTSPAPNNSPILQHNPNSATASYYTKTGTTYRVNFVFFENPTQFFTFPYDIIIPGLPAYNNLQMRFVTPEVNPYDVAIGADIAATNSNMIPMFNQYLPLSAPAIIPYLRLITTTGQTSYEIDYVQKVEIILHMTGNAVDGSDLSFQIIKNNVILATITKNFSATLNDANNVLIGSTPSITMGNLLNNLNQFNLIPGVTYDLNLSEDLSIVLDGNIADLWRINLTVFTAGFSVLSTLDLDEDNVESNIIIPNDLIFTEILYTKVRGSELYISTELTPTSFVKTEFKFFVWTGNMFDTPAEPYIIISKAKIRADQTSIYVNVNPYFRTGLKGDIYNFLNTASFTDAFETTPLETKWAKLVTTNLPETGTTPTSVKIQYYFVLDGYKDTTDYFTDQNTHILMTGLTRFVERGSKHNFFVKAAELNGASYSLSSDINTDIPINIPATSGTNGGFILGIPVDTNVTDEFVEFHLQYEFTNYVIRYYLYDACQSDGFELVFKNRYGVLEGFPVTQRKNNSLETTGADYLRNIVDINGAFDINDHTKKQYNISGSETVTLNSDWLPEYMNAPIKELMMTEELWLVDASGNSLPVIKTQNSMAFKTQRNDKLIQYTISVKMSHDTVFNIQ